MSLAVKRSWCWCSGLISSLLSDQLLNLIPPPETASGDASGSASLAPSPRWPGPPAERWNLRWPLMLGTRISRVLRAELRVYRDQPGSRWRPRTRVKALIHAPSCRLPPSSMLKVIHGGPGWWAGWVGGAHTQMRPLIGCWPPADMWICLGALTYLAATPRRRRKTAELLLTQLTDAGAPADVFTAGIVPPP